MCERGDDIEFKEIREGDSRRTEPLNVWLDRWRDIDIVRNKEGVKGDPEPERDALWLEVDCSRL